MRDGGSFRDPSGFIFYEDGNVYRSINFSYKENFNHLVNSGLYDDLVQKGLLIKHNEVNVAENNPHQYKKLLVEKIFNSKLIPHICINSSISKKYSIWIFFN